MNLKGLDLIEALASKDGVAIEYDGGQYAFSELSALLRDLCRGLDAVRAPSIVPLISSGDPADYVLYLAVLASGRVPAPINGALPSGRVGGILEALDSDVIFGSGASTAGKSSVLMEFQRSVPDVRVLDVARLFERAHRGHMREMDTGDAMYILHTSGSTGEPKGVPITQAQLSSFMGYSVERYELSHSSRVSSNFDLAFDLAAFGIFGMILAGSTLVLPGRRQAWSPVAYASSQSITHWFSVPSLISVAARTRSLTELAMPSLRWSLFCGEQLPRDAAASWARSSPNSVVANLYGPTEVTLCCADYVLPSAVSDWPETSNGSIPIGQVYPHLEARIFGDELQVRGPQRFDGYLDPAANHSSFVDDRGLEISFRKPSTTDWYRTGDVISVEDGLMIHRGRTDAQVKFRGHRVELGEIEHRLRDSVGCSNAAVVVIGDGIGAKISALVVDAPAVDVAMELSAYLPQHMIPSPIVEVRSLPYNTNGKVDYPAVRRLLYERER